jgi:REP element-mobilizing transposase RayT
MPIHVLNRGVGRMRLFLKDADFEAFEAILERTLETRRMRILAYALMPNHWHMILWSQRDGDLGSFIQKLTITHAQLAGLLASRWLRASLLRTLQVGPRRRARKK